MALAQKMLSEVLGDSLSEDGIVKAPLCVELFSGTFGWSRGWLECGGRVVGFDLEHLPHHGPVPTGADLVIQDVLTLHGRQFRDADLILASPPCPEFSYMAMPWSRSKQIAAALRGKGHFPEGYTGSRTLPRLTALFESCFRIQDEACKAAGRYIPMVVENVKGAQPWVGRAKAHFGSFFLFGDIAMVGNRIVGSVPRFGDGLAAAGRAQKREGRNFHAFENGLGSSPSFNGADHETRGVKAPRSSSKSNSRKAASALIARIPLALSRFVAQCYFPSVDDDRAAHGKRAAQD